MMRLYSRYKSTKMTDLWTYLKSAQKPIVLYGTGDGADKIYKRLLKDDIKISGVFASDGFKKGKIAYGFTVTSYGELKEKFGDMIILVCFGSHLDSVIENILRLEKENELYLPDVPVVDGEVFDLAFAKKHAGELTQVYNMLSDEKSKRVFENTVYFKLTGKSRYLREIESDRNEVFELLALKNENFLDLGAFNGDTVEEFIKYCPDYKSIIALEPDSRNFKKLTVSAEKVRNITLINKAISDKTGVINISKNKGRGNSISGKTVEIETTTLSETAKINMPTFIKMDVEGAELSAILGGQEVIRNRPKLHVAAYHRSEDLFSIPLKIKEICPDYKIYMRKHKALPAWDVNYIFI